MLTSGSYPPFVLNKGQTIRGNGSSMVSLACPPEITIDIPAGEVAHLYDLNFPQPGLFPPPFIWGCPLRVQGGTVRLERCTIAVSAVPAISVANADVTIVDCIVAPTLHGSALTAPSSRLTIRDSQLNGTNSACDPHTGLCSFGSSRR